MFDREFRCLVGSSAEHEFGREFVGAFLIVDEVEAITTRSHRGHFHGVHMGVRGAGLKWDFAVV